MNQTKMFELIQMASADLQSLCLAQTGSIHTAATNADKMGWRSPPLDPPGKLGSVLARDISRALYEGDTPSASDITLTWDSCIQDLQDRATARDAIRGRLDQIFPTVPFTGSAFDLLSQFLFVAGWCHGKHSCTPFAVSLKLPRVELGLDQRTSFTSIGRRRLPVAPSGSYRAGLGVTLGTRKIQASKSLGALYHFLSGLMPEKSGELSVLCSAAAFSGRAFEDQLCSMFDIEKLQAEVRRSTVWERARKLVDTSKHNPLKELYALLKDDIERGVFVQKFGNPSRNLKGIGYTPETRARHRALISQAEAGELKAVKGMGTFGLDSLIEIQEMIRGL